MDVELKWQGKGYDDVIQTAGKDTLNFLHIILNIFISYFKLLFL